MLQTIENEALRLSVDTLGAQMHTLLGCDGCQYLWQGDPAFWSGRAPVLFPVIGRLEGKRHSLQGLEYPMGIHGFAAKSEFAVTAHTQETLTLTLTDTPELLEQYPYPFTLEITYRLVGSTVQICSRVRNPGSGCLPFALGGHPGFRVPLEAGEAFTDYYLEFSRCCSPERIGFTGDTVLLNGMNTPFPLESGRVLPLSHELFDADAIILQHMDRQITLRSRCSRRAVTVCYPDMPYLGIWHCPNKPAPYVCIEPWSSLPGRSGVTETLSCRSDFLQLASGGCYENTWTITITGEE